VKVAIFQLTSDKQNKIKQALFLIIWIETLYLVLCSPNTAPYTNYTAVPDGLDG
jgi:hypothetical protein